MSGLRRRLYPPALHPPQSLHLHPLCCPLLRLPHDAGDTLRAGAGVDHHRQRLRPGPRGLGGRDRVEDPLRLLDNPAVTSWIDGLWENARSSLLRAARDPDRVMQGRFGEALRDLGATLRSDPKLKRAINSFARRATVGTVANYGDSIVKLVSDTVRGWDAETVTGRLENAVGRDLQYIRINGTLVGGLVGLTIHTIIFLA